MARVVIFVVIAILFVLSYILTPLVELLTDFWWFDAQDYSSVFWQILWAKVGVGIFFGVTLFFILYINLALAARLTRRDTDNFEYVFGESAELFRQYLNPIILIGSLAISFFLTRVMLGNWMEFLQFLYQEPFNQTDPLYSKDISFYVFSLPVAILLRDWFMSGFVLALVATVFLYFIRGAISSFRNRIYFSPRARTHLFMIGAILFLIKAADYVLQSYALLFSSRGVVHGAGYSDIHALLPAYRVLMVVALIGAAAFVLGAIRRSWKYPIGSLIGLVVVSLLMAQIYPSILQNYFVEPNELQKETPYIEHNIKYTRQAYNLHLIESDDFPARENLTLETLKRNHLTVNNIRLWDWEPLQQTYSQLQEIRLYYDFNDVDIDRYVINEDYQQVMLSVRELNYKTITASAQTWINQHFQYTHGYGICVSPVNIVTREGLPEFFVKDIPPETAVDVFQLEESGIYYGEMTDYYVFVKGDGIKEFDYPEGDTNRMTIYDGEGGVLIGSFFRRLAYSWKWRTLKILVTGHISDETRVMYNRQIKERVGKLAPFLKFDNDPYPVIHNGRIVWIMDAYTSTDKYPYSNSFRWSVQEFPNYIRNSVKVVIDAYNGNVDFYIAEPNDPIIRTYANVFENMFKPISEMPPDLYDNVRYPTDLFTIQSQMLATYHMEDPQVFYNKEDLWNIPTEKYEDQAQTMKSYYLIMKLPGEEEAEMIQLLPFTPTNKDNMIAWFCARCDGDSYGKLLLYKFPKKKLTYGPMQIEARVDQDTQISQLLTLWSQQGSRVIRGNLLVIPIEEAILYVEPIYLKAETGQLPELKQVIVAYGNHVVMRDNLELALEAVFGGDLNIQDQLPTMMPEISGAGEVETTPTPDAEAAVTVKELSREAMQIYQEADQLVRQGDWAAYGEKLKELEDTLRRLEQVTRE